MRITQIVLAIACVALSACASVRTVNSFATVHPLPFEPGDAVLSVASMEMLFIQDATLTDVVRAEGVITGEVPANSLFPTPIRIEQGEQLFRVFLQDDATFMYCSPRNYNNVKACASDEDGNQEFDRVWMMVVVDGESRIIGGTMFGSEATLSPSVPYTKLDEHEIEPVTIGVAFLRSLGGGPWLSVYTLEGGELQLLGLRGVSTPLRALPTTVDVYGARIELLSVTEGVLRYRVLRGFPVGVPFPLVRLQPQEVTVYIP